MKAILKTIPAAMLLAFGAIHINSHAAVISNVCQVNQVNACESRGAEIPASSILTIRGYAFDPATGVKPGNTQGAYILVRNEDTLTDYKLPIQSIEARPDVVAEHIDGILEPGNFGVVNAGFTASVFTSSLPTGHYTVQEVRINMGGSSLVKLDLTDASVRASFRITAESSLFRIVKDDGTIYPISTGKPSAGTIAVTGYQAMRDGDYRIEASLPTIGGVAKKTLDFAYKRPEVSVPVSLPLAEGFPGLDARISLTNPLTNRPLDTDGLPVVVEQAGGENIFMDGKKLATADAMTLSRAGAGLYQTRVKDSADEEGQSSTKLWINLPDAPNVTLVSQRWDPDNKVTIDASATQAPVKVEDIDVVAKLNEPTAQTCQILRTLKSETILGQYNGTDCAIMFTEMPETMKHSTYYANALRGAVSEVGDNKISYSVGVIYTDPATKKTSFYPSKSGVSNIKVTGIEPEKIQLSFENDRLLAPFYEDNQELFPGKYFALTDPAQPRTLGKIQMEAPHKGVRTVITYPGDEKKEAYTTLLKSSVAMTMQAQEPWESKKVLVESWYEKAPEYKTTMEMDFITVPMGPAVMLAKTIASHDQADTIVTGNIGIAKGQNLIFDAAAMGQWQATILDEKTGQSMSTPVQVQADGSFSINLGTLSAGTRTIVAEARMVVAEGGELSNSAVLSKKHSLVTARGEAIEATLAVRNTSGKAPFVQTIATNYKDPKMQSSVKMVTWEYLDADGAWKQVMNGSEPKIGINYMATIEQAGDMQYRAVLTNKYSGMKYTTEPIKLTAFNMPSFTIAGPATVQAKRPVTLSIQAENGFEAEYTWRLVTSGDVEGETTATGQSFTFTPTAVKSYSVEVIGREKGAPNNPAANVKKTASVRAVNPLTARASIQGPRTVEAGQTYEYTAVINDVVSNPAGKAYELKGYWILPDGSRVDGTELSFTPGPDDKLLSFYTYVDGYPEETSVSTYSLSTWKYDWPETWQIRLVPSYLDVPAILKFYVETPGSKMSELRGEELTYTWSLPNGVTRTGSSDLTGSFTIDKAGKYQIALQVADTRGNVTNVTTDEFSILPAATVETQIALVSKYGDDVYAPGSYYISTKTQKLPRGDSFLRHEAIINGEKVGEYTGTGHYVNFEEAGQYEVTIRTLTKSGNYGEQNLSVHVKPAPAPVCEVQVKQSTSGILLTPECVTDAGYVKTYLWTYVLDGETKTSKSKSFLVGKQWLTAQTIGAVTLEVETDLGAKTQVPVNYQP